jgi:hypothetical protein
VPGLTPSVTSSGSPIHGHRGWDRFPSRPALPRRCGVGLLRWGSRAILCPIQAVLRTLVMMVPPWEVSERGTSAWA